MPKHNDRRKRRRGRRGYSALDWFSEDPWAEPDVATDDDDDDDLSVEAWGSEDEELDLFVGDPYDGWGPVRPRRRQSHAR